MTARPCATGGWKSIPTRLFRTGRCDSRHVARLIFLTVCLIWLAALPVGPRASVEPQVWRDANGFRWTELKTPKTGRTGFTLLSASDTGITFTNRLAEEQGAANRVLWNGSGLAVGDYDNDGLPDVFFCGLDTPNALFKNLGNWKFTNVTRQAGLERPGKFFRGAVFADVTGDGRLDLLISTTGQGVLCYRNNGRGQFSYATELAGTGSQFGSVTLALADVDGNGTLDLYIANNRTSDIRDRGQIDIGMRGGQLVIPAHLQDRLAVMQGRLFEYGEPDQLMLNDGKGRFTELSWTNGAFMDEGGLPLRQPPLDWALTVTFRDINGDGAPDLYVCNDYWTPDRMWLNDGRGHFRAAPRLSIRHTSASSMGVDFADINRDGRLDFFVLDMLSRDHRLRRRQMLAQRPMRTPPGVIANRPQIVRNTLFLNRGDDTFAEIADYAGVEASEWSWSPVFLDVDLDGFEDLLIVAGHEKDVQDLDADAQIKARPRSSIATRNETARQQAFTREKMLNARLYPRLDMPIVAFRNLGNLRFEEMTAHWGVDQPGVHHGIATADLDGDGDLDFMVNNLDTAAGVYRNDTAAPRVAVRLRGRPPNTQAIGAKIRLLNGVVPMQSQEVVSGGRYLSGSDPTLVFGATAGEREMTLEVTWRSGKTFVVQGVRSNRLYEINEEFEAGGQALAVKDSTPTAENTARPTEREPQNSLFSDVSQLIEHRHAENEFDDFALQPLLLRRLSQAGPGVAWCDLDGDGHDDLVIGSGTGGQLSVFLGDGKGHFNRDAPEPFALPAARDQSGIVVEGSTILVGTESYESGGVPQAPVSQYDRRARSSTELLPACASSSGPLALGDVDSDGDLDLFVGGRVVPGRWPEAAASRLYLKDSRKWVLHAEHTKALENAGLVSGAVFSDLDGDAMPELLLACEWGPIRVFGFSNGQMRAKTKDWGLDKYTGWWNGVATGDLNGDGKLDVVASNWGLNSPYRASSLNPVRVYFGDLGGRGPVDLFEAVFDPSLQALAPMRHRDALAASLVWLPDKYPTHKAYSEATAEQILGERLAQASSLEVNTLASMAFLNRGARFEPVELPPEAQFAPAYAVTVSDFDGDGAEDVFLSQNFFATDLPRMDAGRGLLLRGDGAGRLSAVPGQDSGLLIYGEQRGAAASDYNEDGRVDLVVTQNGAATRLFQNVGARPALRVRLKGSPANPAAVGAVVRLKFGQRLGPAREVHAGSGYLSQDGPVLVLGGSEPPTGIVVRWPGGAITESSVPVSAREVTLTFGSKMQDGHRR